MKAKVTFFLNNIITPHLISVTKPGFDMWHQYSKVWTHGVLHSLWLKLTMAEIAKWYLKANIIFTMVLI